MLLIPILSLATEEQAKLPKAVRLIEKFVNSSGITLTLESAIIIFLAIYIIRVAIQFWEQIASANLLANFSMWQRNRLYHNMLAAEWLFSLRHKKGQLINSLRVECEKSSNAFYQYLQLLVNIAMMLVYTSTAILISWQFTSALLMASAFISIFMCKIIASGRHTGRTTSETNGEYQSLLDEHIGSLKLIKGSGMEQLSESLLVDKTKQLAELEKTVLINNAKMTWYSQPMVAIMLCGGIYLGIKVFHIDLTSFVVLLFIFMRLYPLTLRIQQSYYKITVFLPSFEYVEKLTDETANLREIDRGIGSPFPIKSGISFRNVCFSYIENIPVLEDISFELRPGRTVALVGGSGAGKSTINDLLLRLLRPCSGEIIVDETSLEKFSLKEWRENIGYVTQDTILLHDTVRTNILWGSKSGISEADMVKAAELANAHDFILKLEHGYDTIIGDRGMRLSGGQRQRIALARALARNPQLLVLDEATSSLDAESERQVQKAIDSLAHSMMIFIISHRLSTIINADRILVMENGVISESGTYYELLARQGRFYELYQMQQSHHGDAADNTTEENPGNIQKGGAS